MSNRKASSLEFSYHNNVLYKLALKLCRHEIKPQFGDNQVAAEEDKEEEPKKEEKSGEEEEDNGDHYYHICHDLLLMTRMTMSIGSMMKGLIRSIEDIT